MKGFQLTTGVILITIGLFSLQTQLVSAAYTMNETCAYVTKGWIADPSSCQSWGYCNGGKLVGTGKCGNGFLYNSKTGNCAYADQVTCASTAVDACKSMATPTMIADPNNCNNYCYCDGNGGAECAKCPTNQSYDPSKNQCVWSSDYACPADSICRLVPNNQFVGDPNLCGNYISCVDGAGTSNQCGGGQFFSPLTGMCTNTSPCGNTGDNGAAPVTTGPGVSAPLKNNPAQCKTYVPGGPPTQFISDGITCMGYYVCTSPSEPGTWAKCPLGTHFNPTTQKCATPYTVQCTYDRCANINQAFVTAPKTNCNSYLICKNQTKQNVVGTCPANYPFFDEFVGACVVPNPDYAICSP